MKCKGPLCGIDSETLLIENKFTWPDVVVAGFASQGEVQIVPWQYLPEYQPKFVAANPNTKFVFFNNAFDINVMGRELWLAEMEKDNRIMELSVSYKIYLAGTQGWIPRKLTLYDVVKRLLGVELNKEDGTRTSFTRNTPLTEQQIIYLAEDCIGTELCGLVVNNMPTETLQARASFVLSEISHNGLLVDQAHLEDMRKKLALQMADLAKELRTFGFVVKKDTDKMTQLQRIGRVCELFGVSDVAKHVEASGKKQFPRAALWILTANLYALFQAYGRTALPSDIKDVITSIVSPVLDPAIDWSAKNKAVKCLEDQATELIRTWLTEIECGDAVPLKSPKADVALTILEIFEQFYHAPETEFTGDWTTSVNNEFQMCYDENLGWLSGAKPQTNAEYIQKHLNGLINNNPSLELPLTESSQDSIKEYLAECRNKNTPPDPQVLKDKAIYACKRQEMWRLRDLNITDPFLDKYTEYKHAEKLLGTYFNPEHVAEDGRAHTRFSDFLITGRTASSGPNLQNLPREKGLREMYLAPEGHVLVSCDYGMEEMITLAATLVAWFGKSRMADAINAGYCLHCLFALYRDGGLADIDMNNLTDPEIVKIVKERCAPYKQDKVLKARRQVAKIANFGKK